MFFSQSMKTPGIMPIFNAKGDIATKIRYEPISLLEWTGKRNEDGKPIPSIKKLDEIPSGAYLLRTSYTIDGFSHIFLDRAKAYKLLITTYLDNMLWFGEAKTPIIYRVWWFDEEKQKWEKVKV